MNCQLIDRTQTVWKVNDLVRLHIFFVFRDNFYFVCCSWLKISNLRFRGHLGLFGTNFHRKCCEFGINTNSKYWQTVFYLLLEIVIDFCKSNRNVWNAITLTPRYRLRYMCTLTTSLSIFLFSAPSMIHVYYDTNTIKRQKTNV